MLVVSMRFDWVGGVRFDWRRSYGLFVWLLYLLFTTVGG